MPQEDYCMPKYKVTKRILKFSEGKDPSVEQPDEVVEEEHFYPVKEE